jgi:hypothetical protein
MSALAWLALMIVAVSLLLVAALVGAVLICLELTVDPRTDSRHPGSGAT